MRIKHTYRIARLNNTIHIFHSMRHHFWPMDRNELCFDILTAFLMNNTIAIRQLMRHTFQFCESDECRCVCNIWLDHRTHNSDDVSALVVLLLLLAKSIDKSTLTHSKYKEKAQCHSICYSACCILVRWEIKKEKKCIFSCCSIRVKYPTTLQLDLCSPFYHQMCMSVLRYTIHLFLSSHWTTFDRRNRLLDHIVFFLVQPPLHPQPGPLFSSIIVFSNSHQATLPFQLIPQMEWRFQFEATQFCCICICRLHVTDDNEHRTCCREF